MWPSDGLNHTICHIDTSRKAWRKVAMWEQQRWLLVRCGDCRVTGNLWEPPPRGVGGMCQGSLQESVGPQMDRSFVLPTIQFLGHPILTPLYITWYIISIHITSPVYTQLIRPEEIGIISFICFLPFETIVHAGSTKIKVQSTYLYSHVISCELRTGLAKARRLQRDARCLTVK